MTEQIQTISYRESGVDAVERNKVLRNTYWLLALTLVPTVIGAWMGIATGIGRYLSGGLGLVVFLAAHSASFMPLRKPKNLARASPCFWASHSSWD